MEQPVTLPARDGIAPAARRWATDAPAKAILVVAHGMGEHAGRYQAPLLPLIEAGYVTYALDHRGHGHTAADEAALGDYGPGGFAGVVDDLHALVEQARREHPDLPLALLGHSMGSMIAQAYLLDHADALDALVLSGSAAVDVVAHGAALAAESGGHVFAAMNSAFEPGRTGFEWLSRDEGEVDRYVADPLCGFPLQPDSFADLLAQGPRLTDPDALAAIPRELPILLAYGLRDPLNEVLHGVDPLIARYRAAGLDLTVRAFPDARHEILNETNRAEVVGTIHHWLDAKLSR